MGRWLIAVANISGILEAETKSGIRINYVGSFLISYALYAPVERTCNFSNYTAYTWSLLRLAVAPPPFEQLMQMCRGSCYTPRMIRLCLIIAGFGGLVTVERISVLCSILDYHCFIVSWIINTSLEFVFEQLFRCLRLGWMISGRKLFIRDIIYGLYNSVSDYFFFFFSWNLKRFFLLLLQNILQFIGINIDFLFSVKLWKIFIRI